MIGIKQAYHLSNQTITLQEEITERKQAEKDLKLQQELFESIFLSIPVMITIYQPEINMMKLNKNFEETVGWTNEDIKTIDLMEKCYPDPEYREKAAEYMQAATNEWREFQIKTKPGNLIDSIWSNIRLTDNTQIGIGIDITDRKKFDDKIKASLKEKETLLQEIHHRVKNNLSVISSLLGLQITNTNDPKLTAALDDSRSRVNSMSMIHEVLYQSESLSQVDMKTYLSKLANDMARNYEIASSVKIDVDIEDVKIGAKQASPVGLIVNEMITNSFKYAFADKQNGEIRISLTETDGRFGLKYSDNGSGIPDNVDLDNPTSMGLRLIKILSEGQLDGSVQLNRDHSTCFIVDFDKEEKTADSAS